MKLLLVLTKLVLVFGLIAVGVILLVRGGPAAAETLPFLKYKDIEAHNVPAGIVAIGAGLVLAIFWKIKMSPDGGIELMGPPP